MLPGGDGKLRDFAAGRKLVLLAEPEPDSEQTAEERRRLAEARSSISEPPEGGVQAEEPEPEPEQTAAEQRELSHRRKRQIATGQQTTAHRRKRKQPRRSKGGYRQYTLSVCQSNLSVREHVIMEGGDADRHHMGEGE